VIARYKHASLFGRVVSNEGKKFYNIVTWSATTSASVPTPTPPERLGPGLGLFFGLELLLLSQTSSISVTDSSCRSFQIMTFFFVADALVYYF
jgi:hypothetical protein